MLVLFLQLTDHLIQLVLFRYQTSGLQLFVLYFPLQLFYSVLLALRGVLLLDGFDGAQVFLGAIADHYFILVGDGFGRSELGGGNSGWFKLGHWSLFAAGSLHDSVGGLSVFLLVRVVVLENFDDGLEVFVSGTGHCGHTFVLSGEGILLE